jgi:hypothetical protein
MVVTILKDPTERCVVWISITEIIDYYNSQIEENRLTLVKI